jgi:hypothetical protein
MKRISLNHAKTSGAGISGSIISGGCNSSQPRSALNTSAGFCPGMKTKAAQNFKMAAEIEFPNACENCGQNKTVSIETTTS